MLLGVFVLGASVALARRRLLGPVVRWVGYFAGSLAVLSVLSLVFFYAGPLLPVGRVLSMIWTVVAAVQLVRRSRSGKRIHERDVKEEP